MVESVIKTDRKIKSAGGTMDYESTDLNNTAIKLNFVRNKLLNFQSTIVRDVDRRMSGVVEEILQEIREHELQTHAFRFFDSNHTHQNNTWSNRVINVATQEKTSDENTNDENENQQQEANDKICKFNKETKKKKFRPLPDKIFTMRESYLTALLKVDHMKTIYHIFHIILIVFLLNSLCYDFFVEGRVNFGLRTFKTGLNKIDHVFYVWILEHIVVFALYYAFCAWAKIRVALTQSKLRRIWSYSCLTAYISTQLVFGYIASAFCLKMDLPFVTASVLLLETTRLLMKMHSFVRTNTSRVIAGKQKTDDDNNIAKVHVQLPTFKSYLYFLFAPTLIYRDSYPRTSQIRWKFAFARLMEVVAVSFLYSYIHERHIEVHFQNYGREPITAPALIVKLFGMLMPSIIIYLCGFYLILHSWLNFTAELLRFGDRMFYKDWWTSATYDAYYRNWNVVVHDWLYEYIYKDFYNYVCKGQKTVASLMVFGVSALVHEHILGFALQLFFPVMFVFFFGAGFLFIFITRRLPKNLGNISLWFSLIFGNGLMIALYCAEYYARQNCPKTYNEWIDYLTPALINCPYSFK